MTHKGAINSDEVLRPYEQAYADMPRKYRLEDRRISLYQRIWRWLMAQIGY